MVRGALRSRSQARIKRKLPGNTTTVHYIRRRPKHAHCPITGEKLHGVPRLRPAQLRKLAKTKRRPNRAYGGKISPTALSRAIRSAVLAEMEDA